MTKKSLSLFVISFGFAYISTLFYLKHSQAQSKVLSISQSSQLKIQATVEGGYVYGPFYEPIEKKAVAVAVDPKPTVVHTPQPTAAPTPEPTQTPESTPTPDPTPTPDVWSPPEMESIFSGFAGQYGIDKNILERLANCESHFNPNATNGDYLGMFQFSKNTWISTRQQMGEDTNPDLRSNVEESIQTAAYLIATRGTTPWPRCLN